MVVCGGVLIYFFSFTDNNHNNKNVFIFHLRSFSPETQQGQSKEGNDLQSQGGKHYLVAQAPVLTLFESFHDYFSEELYASLEKYLTSGRVQSERKKGVCVSIMRYF